MRIVHRMNSNGRPRCGAESGLCSVTGSPATVTCPACTELCRVPSRAEMLANYERSVRETLARGAARRTA